MSQPKVPTVVSEYTEALRAYHLRLAEWLDLDPSLVFDLRDKDVRIDDGFAHFVMTDVCWKTQDRPHEAQPADGRTPMPLAVMGDGDGTTFTNGVHLDALETERMREVVGARPEMFTPPELLMLDGLRWRAEQEQKR